MKRVGVLISGRGSNLGALIAAAREPHYPAEIALVLCDRPGALGLVRAAEAAIATQVIERERYAGRAAFERAIGSALIAYRIELVALAGFMRVLSEDFVARWRDRMINIHPSLLPSYRGLDTHRRALAEGVRIHGCTVHFVRPEFDHGPIIAQAAVPVLTGDTPETLAARVLDAEHILYPKTLALVASGQVWVEGERVASALPEVPQPPLISPPP
ncbi:MAG: phosphoribosylglycinamide formyltransferase [Hyphomicrobiales bacterium]